MAITQKELKKNFLYNEDLGIFHKIKKDGNLSKKCGTIDKSGYVRVIYKHKYYRVHRLAWLYVYGYLPEEIDHINKVRSDNRLKNLRECTRSENQRNRTQNKNNTSGVTGVCFDTESNRWLSQINIDGKQVKLGRFLVFSDAVNARKNAEILYNYTNN